MPPRFTILLKLEIAVPRGIVLSGLRIFDNDNDNDINNTFNIVLPRGSPVYLTILNRHCRSIHVLGNSVPVKRTFPCLDISNGSVLALLTSLHLMAKRRRYRM